MPAGSVDVMTSTPTPDHPSTSPSTSSPTGTPARRVLSARGPEDLLAAVPVVLGFEPRDSAVLMTFGGPRPFHARVDLPTRPEDAEAVAEVLLEPSLRHEVEGVALLIYADAADETARRTTAVLHERFEAAGLRVLALVRADGGRWWRPGQGPARATAYDLSAHPFRVQSVVDGRVTHSSRDALAATLATDPAGAARVAAVLCEPVPAGGAGPGIDAVDVAVMAAHHVQQGSCFTDEELADVAVGIELPGVRDGGWTLMTRPTARAHVRLWSDAVRRTPPDLLGGPAAVLGFAAWLAGDGALAWCAVDRARGADPDNTLATLVADLLTSAVPPTTWSDLHGTDEGEEPGFL